MKTISIFLSFINALLAGLLIAFNLSSNGLYHAEVWWSLIKIAASLTVIMLGVITWLASMNESHTGLVLFGGVILVVLGTVTIMWTLHLAILNGDMKYYMIGYGASLMTQGMASLLGFGEDGRKMIV